MPAGFHFGMQMGFGAPAPGVPNPGVGTMGPFVDDLVRPLSTFTDDLDRELSLFADDLGRML